MVRLVLLEVYGDHKAHHGLGWAEGKHNIVFYAYYSRKEGRNPIWVQMTLTLVVSVFDMMGLLKNIGDTKSMVCTPGFIWEQHGTTAYKKREMGEGGKFL